jgi:hypothetical protein
MISDETINREIYDPMSEDDIITGFPDFPDTMGDLNSTEDVVNSDSEESQRAVEGARILTSINTVQIETDENTLELPDEFKCPIGLDLMNDPVMAADGQSYERAKINRWFRNSRLSPITGLRLNVLDVFPNTLLRNQINIWLTQQGREELPQMPENILLRNRNTSDIHRRDPDVDELVSSLSARYDAHIRDTHDRRFSSVHPEVNVTRDRRRTRQGWWITLSKLVLRNVERVGGNLYAQYETGASQYETGASVIRRLQELNCKKVLVFTNGEYCPTVVVDDNTNMEDLHTRVYRVISGPRLHSQQVVISPGEEYNHRQVYREYPTQAFRAWIWYENLDNNSATEMMMFYYPRLNRSAIARAERRQIQIPRRATPLPLHEIAEAFAVSPEEPFRILRRNRLQFIHPDYRINDSHQFEIIRHSNSYGNSERNNLNEEQINTPNQHRNIFQLDGYWRRLHLRRGLEARFDELRNRPEDNNTEINRVTNMPDENDTIVGMNTNNELQELNRKCSELQSRVRSIQNNLIELCRNFRQFESILTQPFNTNLNTHMDVSNT